MKDRYNSFRHDNQILNTVESTENPKILEDERISHSKINMPAIKQENKQFLNSNTSVKAIHRGSSAKYKHEVAYSDSLAPLKEMSEPQKTISNAGGVMNEVSSRKLKSGKKKMQEAEILYTNAQKEQKSIYQQFHNAVR